MDFTQVNASINQVMVKRGHRLAGCAAGERSFGIFFAAWVILPLPLGSRWCQVWVPVFERRRRAWLKRGRERTPALNGLDTCDLFFGGRLCTAILLARAGPKRVFAKS